MPKKPAPPTLTQRVAAIITTARLARGVTVMQIAELAETDYETTRRKLNGVGPMTLPELAAFCAAVGTVPSKVLAKVERDTSDAATP